MSLTLSTAHTPTCCIWAGTDKGNVVMMTVNIESPDTEDQPRTVELGRRGVFACLSCVMCLSTYACDWTYDNQPCECKLH